MTTRPEMLREETMGREEALGVAGRFELLPPMLPLPGGLMRISRSIVQIPMLGVCEVAWC